VSIFTLVIVLLLVPLWQAKAQRNCWDTLRRLLEEDPSVRATVDHAIKTACLESALKSGETELRENLLPIVVERLRTGSDMMRVSASGLIAFLSMLRPDGASVVPSLIDVVAEHFSDPAPRVRANLIIAIASLKPEIPDRFAPRLETGLSDPHISVWQRAFEGVVRLNPVPPVLEARLIDRIDEATDVALKGNLTRWLGEIRRPSERVLSLLLEALRAKQPYLRESSLAALHKMGPAAARISFDIRRLTDDQSGDPAFAERLRALIKAIDR